MMARLLADAANREGTREALFAGLSDGVPDIRGTCALLLLQSGEPAQPRLLRALVGAFAHADSETGHAASELMTRLLTDETSRDWAREALVAGLDDDVASVRTTCHQLLQMLR